MKPYLLERLVAWHDGLDWRLGYEEVEGPRRRLMFSREG